MNNRYRVGVMEMPILTISSTCSNHERVAHASIIGDLGMGYQLVKDQALAYHSLGVDDNTCPDNTTATYSRIQNTLRLQSGRTARGYSMTVVITVYSGMMELPHLFLLNRNVHSLEYQLYWRPGYDRGRLMG